MNPNYKTYKYFLLCRYSSIKSIFAAISNFRKQKGLDNNNSSVIYDHEQKFLAVCYENNNKD